MFKTRPRARNGPSEESLKRPLEMADGQESKSVDGICDLCWLTPASNLKRDLVRGSYASLGPMQ